MKRIKILLLACIIFVFAGAVALASDEESNGYIVKLNTDVMLLSTDDSQIKPLGDGLYKVSSEELLNEFLSNECVETYFPDCKLELFEEKFPQATSDTWSSSQWALDVMGAQAARKAGAFGQGVRIAIIDSGIKADHLDLNRAKILEGYNCLGTGDGITDVTDNYGHGTKVAGIIAAQIDNELDIAGIAGEVEIYPVKVTDGKNFDLSNALIGIKKAVESDCDIINMSFGASISSAGITEFQRVINEATDAGCVVVASAGNGGDTSINYPAGLSNVIGVGSVDSDLAVSDFSQKNVSVDVVAPGKNVRTLSNLGGSTAVSGTSFSAPQVAAVACLIKGICPDMLPSEVEKIIKETAIDKGDSGYDTSYGYGIVNIENIIGRLEDKLPDFVVSQGMKDGTKRVYVHNNRDCVINLNCYYAKFSGKKMESVGGKQTVDIQSGVTPFNLADNFNSFFIWDKNLKPYTKRYEIK